MPNVDNASIRYLMKEMDPSDELLMEREMLEDEDLLIEVESMRRTHQRLNRDLPMVDPPARITEGIIKQASEREKSSRPPVRMFGLYRYQYTAAAAVVIGMLGGLVWLQTDPVESPASSEQGSSPSVASTSAPPNVSPSVSNSTSTPSTSTPVSSDMESTAAGSADQGAGVEPWIDKNEVLRFQEGFANENSAAYDSILNNSTRKLTPIDDNSLQNNLYNRSLRLTGSD